VAADFPAGLGALYPRLPSVSALRVRSWAAVEPDTAPRDDAGLWCSLLPYWPAPHHAIHRPI